MTIKFEIRKIYGDLRVLQLRGSIDADTNVLRFVQMLDMFYPMESYTRRFWREEVMEIDVDINNYI